MEQPFHFLDTESGDGQNFLNFSEEAAVVPSGSHFPLLGSSYLHPSSVSGSAYYNDAPSEFSVYHELLPANPSFSTSVPTGPLSSIRSGDQPIGGWIPYPDYLQQQENASAANGLFSQSESLQESLGVGGVDTGAEEAPVEEKPLADFATQRFRRVNKVSNSTPSQKKAGAAGRKRTAGDRGANLTKKRGTVGNAAPVSGSAPLVGAAENGEVEEDAIDEVEQAEADEFFSQLIDLTPGDPGPIGRSATNHRKNGLRWHVKEAEFFRRCARLYDTNFVMIKEFFRHRSVGDLKKQYDKQRGIFPSLFASFGTTPRFETVEEYYQLKMDLEEEKEAFEKKMYAMGVKPWVEINREGTDPPRSPSQECTAAPLQELLPINEMNDGLHDES